MLEITISENEGYDERSGKFFTIKKTTIQLEHSLFSVSEWEKKWHKPFLNEKDKSFDEIQNYIECMTLNDVQDKEVYKHLSSDVIKIITDYIKNPMTATKITENGEKKAGISKNKVITSEMIYGWMIILNIPSEYQYWHLNRLMTLIKVVNIQNSPKKKMGKQEEARQRQAIVAARRAKYNSRG